MADRWYVDLHLDGYQTNTNTHIITFRSSETYKIRGLTTMSPSQDHSMFMLTSRLIRSRSLFEARVSQELLRFGVNEESLRHFPSQIFNYSVGIVSLFGDTGFKISVTLDFVTDATVAPLVNGYDYLQDYIHEYTNMCDDEGVDDAALSDAEVEERAMEALSTLGRNTGVAVTVITKLRRIGRVNWGDVSGVCSLCSDAFLPTSEILKLPCGHQFHDSCIVQYLQHKKTCPVCRIIIK